MYTPIGHELVLKHTSKCCIANYYASVSFYMVEYVCWCLLNVFE